MSENPWGPADPNRPEQHNQQPETPGQGWGPNPAWNPPGPVQPQGPGQSQPAAPWGQAPPSYPNVGQPPPGMGYQPGPGAAYGYIAPAIRPGIIPLRPLNLGDVYDGAISAIRLNPASMLGLPAVIGVVSALLGLLFVFPIMQMDTNAPPSTGAVLGMGSLGLVAVVLSLVLSMLLTGALTVAVGQAIFGRKTSPGELLRAAREHLGRLVLLSLLGGLAAFVLVAVMGLITFGVAVTLPLLLILVIPAFLVLLTFLAIRFFMSSSALVLERIGPVAAVERAWKLSGRGFWRLTGILVVTYIICLVISWVIQLPLGIIAAMLGAGISTGTGSTGSAAGAIASLALNAVSSLLAQALIAPFVAAVSTLLYLDARMRQEGLDVQLVQEANNQARQQPGGSGYPAPGNGPF